MINHFIIPVTLCASLVLTACTETTIKPTATPAQSKVVTAQEPGTPVKATVGLGGLSVKMSDGTVCKAPRPKDAKGGVGSWTGSFPNCPSISYTLNVTSAIDVGAVILFGPFAKNSSPHGNIDVTIASGKSFNLPF